MGREQPSFQPTHPSRDERAKRAKGVVNKTIPAILNGNPRARRGVEAAELIVDPPPVTPTKQRLSVSQTSQNNGLAQESSCDASTSKTPIKIVLQVMDTLQAAHQLITSSPAAHGRRPRVAILNMASPLRPGGGVLSGASSQEEWLCTRTMLYPSLREEFYRLPEVGGVYTPDVLVFRSWDEDASELEKKDWFYVDVITAAMLRFPDLDGQGEEASYAEQKDRDLVLGKMRAVMRILRLKRVEKIVLGAWGCGAYGNPVREVARAWRKVLLGPRQRRTSTAGTARPRSEDWSGLDVIFAIKDPRMAERFARDFGNGLEIDPQRDSPSRSYSEDDENSGSSEFVA